jgi:transcriptional regulator with XRE-family HTH domain
METFGQRVAEMRRQRVLTQKELADKAGLATVTVSRIETGGDEANPRPGTVRRLAAALGVDAKWLRFGVEHGKRAARSKQATQQHPTPLGRGEGIRIVPPRS